MTKGSRRSSVVDSAHLSPREVDGGTPPPELQREGDVGTISPPKTAIIESKGITKVTGLATDAAVEVLQPAPSNLPSTKAENGIANANSSLNALGTATAYGTRSRNRAGNSRPNYAEDKELDTEFELAVVKENAARKGAKAVDLPEGPDGRNPGGVRKGHTESDELLMVHVNHRDAIPGTSTFSAHTPGANSNPPLKKRKAAVQGNPASFQPQPQAIPQVPPQGQHATHRANLTAQVLAGFRESNMLSFDQCGGRLRDNKLIADDGTALEVNDHAYLVCEPPGEPYYLGRIMEFLHVNNESSQPIDALRLNWYYRPKDIGRSVNDTRQVFASMHSDISPLTALRGKCQIKHKSEVEDIDALRRSKDSFWYEKLYDRYIHRYYDVIPTNQVINVPVDVKKVLDERWKYIVVEPGRGKELTSAVKSCKRCNKYCAGNDSVDCAVCQNTYHMSCVSPPLLKKPSRGFAWACGPCSKAQEKKLEARNTPNVTDPTFSREEENHEDDGESPDDNSGDLAADSEASPAVSNEVEVSFNPGTAEQIHQASLWLFRYLGIHCKVEDALDYDDRIYPRASTRLGPRYQANVLAWPGRPIEYVKPFEVKKRNLKGGGHKKDAKLSKDTIAALEADKAAREQRPKWVMDEPPGYVARGEDYDNNDQRNTAQLMYKKPEAGEVSAVHEDGSELDAAAREQLVFGYMARAGGLARPLGLPEFSTNLLDVALETLRAHGFEVETALRALVDADRKVFKEPELTPAELKRFEDGVAKYGSEWHSIKKHVRTLKPRDIVRFYYTWKKTDRGRQVWGNYSGRKGKKEAKKAEVTTGKLQDDVADEYDDSAFDNDKAFEKKRGFQCKFCTTRSSRQWRRAPNTPAGSMIPETPGVKVSGKDKGTWLMIALCRRCAELWRRYGIQWEDVDEVAKKVAQAGGRAWKRKIDEELLKELVAANRVMNHPPSLPLPPLSTSDTSALSILPLPGTEAARKKTKVVVEPADQLTETNSVGPLVPKRKAPVEKPPPPPPPPPEPLRPKILPCSICHEMDPPGDQLLACKECRLSVHRNCYGVMGENRSTSKWLCDMCSNDKNPQVSVQYRCMLCPVEHTEHDFVEPPKPTHKKKTEKDREREKAERENNQKAADFFRKKQEEMNKPVNPREPLKRTANNNWVHVTCAVFTPEVKFGNAKALEPSEGIPSIASARYDDVCKACKQRGGACVACHACKAPVHVECAHQGGYVLGFDLAPVKGSRREQVNVVNIHGNVGLMTAALWCKEHVPTKTTIHLMHDIVDNSGLNALQLYVQNFKQADLALTGTVRKATLVNQSTKATNPLPSTQIPNRRASTTSTTHNNTVSNRIVISSNRAGEGVPRAPKTGVIDRMCATCEVDVSPKWWPFPPTPPDDLPLVPISMSAGPSMLLESTTEPIATDHIVSHHSPVVGHAALAAAALHQHPKEDVGPPKEVQCHQCHWKKARRDPTPPPANFVVPQDNPRAPVPGLSNISITTPDVEDVQSVAHYAWPQPPPPAYSSGGPPYGWRRHTPPPQVLPVVNQLSANHSSHSQMNGAHSPLVNHASVRGHSGQSQMRQSTQSIPRSPRQNGHTNGYPPSPHHMTSSAVNMSNGAYVSYGAPHSGPRHSVTGALSPRVLENPFSQGHPPSHHRTSFGPSQGSPPLFRESRPHSRENGHTQNLPRPNDGRVNGGASASPSLRNLLS